MIFQGLRVLKTDERGFWLVQSLVGITLFALVTTLVAGYFRDSFKSLQKSLTQESAKMIHKNIFNSLSSSQAFLLTVQDADNSDMQCLDPTVIPAIPCVANPAGYVFRLRNAANEIIMDNDATSGININGETCDTYNAASGNIHCPFKYELTWKPLCPPVGACMNPAIEITGTFKFSIGGNPFPLNTSQYDILTTR